MRTSRKTGETAMSGIDDISARLTVLETVVRQLVTHLAVRSDDPVGWVQTRKVLAQRVVHEDGLLPPRVGSDRMGAAISGFFDPVEDVVASYTFHTVGGTDRSHRR
jgi:hypothetical protein